MAEPFVGEIRMFAGNYAPQGWALCNGASLSIGEYQVLFAVLGVTYGGNGQTTFGLPDLQGRVALSQGTGPALTSRIAGQKGGVEQVSLLETNIPPHFHPANASTNVATTSTAGPSVLMAAVADTTAGQVDSRYLPAGKPTNGGARVLNAAAVASSGQGVPHDNIMPGCAINYIIAVAGVYPNGG
jgi:microcystin-dependent protein